MKEKERIYNLTVTKHINGPYRQYALYTLEHRGIPNFYDGLTNVQRLVLINAPSSFKKTLGVSGKVMETGLYHHGDSSLTGAISKLAKKFGCSEPILLGDGFFGSPVKHEPAAPRYTQVKLSPVINEIINKNWSLNEKNIDGAIEKLEVEFPIGLLTHTIGIAVGYSTNIMPRNFNQINEYLDNKLQVIPPYFKNFNGVISKYDNTNSWLISGVHSFDNSKKEVRITEIPPVMKYETFLAKLENISSIFPIKVKNNSTDKIDITIKLISGDNFDELVTAIDKANKLLFSENVVMIKDSKIVEYSKVEDYLDDFKLIRFDVQIRKIKQEISEHLEEDEYLRKKILFIQFMVTKQHTTKEVDNWIENNAPLYSRKLDSVRAKELVKETIDLINSQLKDNEKIRKTKEKNLEDLIKKYEKVSKNHVSKAKITTNKSESTSGEDENDEEFERFDPTAYLEEEIEN